MEKVQAFGTIRSCPFKALRLPKERIGLGTRWFVWVEVLIGPILGVGSMRPQANMGGLASKPTGLALQVELMAYFG